MQFIYLDGKLERKQLIKQVQSVRQVVLEIAAQVPEREHYTPRYGDRSLALVLAHLQVVDTAALWFINAASNGYRVRPPRRLIHSVDNLLMRLFRQRLVSVSIKGIRKKETEICEFIRTIPLDKLSADVLHPGRKEPYTVEKALQVYFVHHWQQQLAIMQAVDSITGEL